MILDLLFPFVALGIAVKYFLFDGKKKYNEHLDNLFNELDKEGITPL